MTESGAELVELFVGAWNRRDFDGWLECFSADAEIVFPASAELERGSVRGLDDITTWGRGFMASWQEHRVAIERILEVGNRVAVLFHVEGIALDGSPVDSREGHVFETKAGRIARSENFPEPKDAFAAVAIYD